MTIAPITCVYRNETSSMQIVRLDEVSDFYLERLVMPGQCLMFEAPATAALQIHAHAMAGAILADTIPCWQLQHEAEAAMILPFTPSLAQKAA